MFIYIYWVLTCSCALLLWDKIPLCVYALAGCSASAADAEDYRIAIGDWTEPGKITLENWTKEEPKPDDWKSWMGNEPAWFKTGRRKVVTDADYSRVPAGMCFACVKLVNADFRVGAIINLQFDL